MNQQRARRQRIIKRLEMKRDRWVQSGIASGEDYVALCERLERLQQREAACSDSSVLKKSPARLAGTMRYLWVGGKSDGESTVGGKGSGKPSEKS